MVVESVKGKGRGRPRKTWRQCVDEDMTMLNLSVMDTHDCMVWRNGILGNRLARAVARKNDINNDYDDLGHRLKQSPGETRSGRCLFQCISVSLQRYNAVAFKGSFSMTPRSNNGQSKKM